MWDREMRVAQYHRCRRRRTITLWERTASVVAGVATPGLSHLERAAHGGFVSSEDLLALSVASAWARRKPPTGMVGRTLRVHQCIAANKDHQSSSQRASESESESVRE